MEIYVKVFFYFPCSMFVCVHHQSAEPVYATVELSGQLTRGQMVVDWDGLLQQPCNALVVKELDIDKIQVSETEILICLLVLKPGKSVK